MGEKVLADEDYRVPCHGIADTGPEKRLLGGKFFKDDGVHSSRINQIVKQAGHTPGPGKYCGVHDWEEKGAGGLRGSKFLKCPLGVKMLNKTPAPDVYEGKNLTSGARSIASGTNLSQNKSILFGPISKGERRSFLASMEKISAQTPGPGKYEIQKHGRLNCMDPHSGTTSYKETKAVSRKETVKGSLAPNAYNPNFKHAEPSQPTVTFPKETGKNFVDKVVSGKWLDSKTKKMPPGPGAHELVDLSKVSRGTKICQIRGLSRSAVSGYF